MNYEELMQDYKDALESEQQAYRDLKEASTWLGKCMEKTQETLLAVLKHHD